MNNLIIKIQDLDHAKNKALMQGDFELYDKIFEQYKNTLDKFIETKNK